MSNDMQISSASAFLQDAFSASAEGKKRVVVDGFNDEQGQVSWHVEGFGEKVKRLFSFKPITAEQNQTFANTVLKIADHTQSSVDRERADAVFAAVDTPRGLPRNVTAVYVAFTAAVRDSTEQTEHGTISPQTPPESADLDIEQRSASSPIPTVPQTTTQTVTANQSETGTQNHLPNPTQQTAPKSVNEAFGELSRQPKLQQALQGEHSQLVAAEFEALFQTAEEISKASSSTAALTLSDVSTLNNDANTRLLSTVTTLPEEAQASVLEAFEPALALLNQQVEDFRIAAVKNPTSAPTESAKYSSAQDLVNYARTEVGKGVNPDTIQIDLKDLGRIDAEFEINQKPLTALADPSTGKIPLRTAIIAYGLAFPKDGVSPRQGGQPISSSAAITIQLDYEPDPSTPGPNDRLFSETSLGEILSRKNVSGRSPQARLLVAAPIDLKTQLTPQQLSYQGAKVAFDNWDPAFQALSSETRKELREAFASQAQWRNDPRFGVVLTQLATYISGLQAAGTSPQDLSARAHEHFYKLVGQFQEFPDARHHRLANLLVDGADHEVRRLHIYAPGPVYDHPETPDLKKRQESSVLSIVNEPRFKAEDEQHRATLLSLDPENTLVIGNGGAGAAGLIKHLAVRYQQFAENQGDKPPTIVWRFGDSNQNFQAIKHEDLAITYEPNDEKALLEQGVLAQVQPAFFNHLELAGPPNPPFKVTTPIDDSPDQPVRALAEIIAKSIDLYDDNGKPKKTYFSRYNASAVGTKDEILFRKAVKHLLNGPSRADILRRGDIDTTGLNEQQIEARLYQRWIEHVVTDRSASVIKAASESKEKGYFHLNDRAILLQEGVAKENWITATPNKPDALFLNPAQIIGAKHSLESTHANKFVSWLRSEDGQAAVASFRLKKGEQTQQPYESFGNVTFDELVQNVEALEKGTEIDKIWRPEATKY